MLVTVSEHGTRQRSRVHVTPAEGEAVVTVRIPEAALWWPRGYGEQAQYDVELQTADGDVPDRQEFRTGFRALRANTAPDEQGRPFVVRVNAIDIDVRGTNWIPDDAILSRVDRRRYNGRLGVATRCNVNLVRA